MRRLLPSAVLNITRRLGKESVLRPLDVPVQELVLGLCPTYAHLVLRHPTRSLDVIRVYGTCASWCAIREASILTPLFSGVHARDACAISFSNGRLTTTSLTPILLPPPPPQSEMADTDTGMTERRFSMPRRNAVVQACSMGRFAATSSTLKMRARRG